MATEFIHVVGKPGSRKSTLILAFAAYYEALGKSCAGQDPDIFRSRREALEHAPGADIFFIEHTREQYLDALPGDLVIRMEHVTVLPELAEKLGTPAPLAEGGTHA